ncbi:TonB-dependent receptor [Sphingomonas faeni]|uniref:TonB-dependent receptor n=1 Tax=Sphingomonas faeni TaxID=185950 RepID=UPI002789B11B|nr:TonB-dependent receptor [Sphingomonas faeni]MDQ0839463.1 iron complex outermembrane receptor protein [Sphingomonas faeni]
MRTMLACGVAFAALMIPAAAFAQSTGSQSFDESSEIVVSGRKEKAVGGVEIPDSPKAKVLITSELIQRQRVGQSINEVLNLVPGVSFTNNDPWGSSGGSFTIRGFNSDRISQTFDGVPLNDSGNYAVYTNQQLDSELIENVNVNLGSTDVDSPTASAVGGTVNINSLRPSDTMGGLVTGSYGNIIAPGSGDRPYTRVFGMIQTGDFTGHGTKAWFAASNLHNEPAFANYGGVQKSQFNAKLWQDIGSNGDFVSIAGHYNVNRNNFGGSPLTAAGFVDANGNINVDKSRRFYNIGYGTGAAAATGGAPCNTAAARPGLADLPNACGTSFERRYNPSNTGNARFNSRFTLAEGLIFSADAAYQTSKANGGGVTTSVNGTTGAITGNAREGAYVLNGQSLYGFYGGGYYFGRDLNGDGDILDRVTLLNPSQTKTNRYTAVANLSYELNDQNRVRLSYTFDRANHRQTGELDFIDAGGEPFDVFPVNEPIFDVNGNVVQKRDRKSFATLNQVSGEYRGQFLEEKLTVLLGVRAPFFKRELNQNCFTTGSNGNVDCPSSGALAAYQAANPYLVNATTGVITGAAAPQQRNYKYDKLLPNIGATFHLTPTTSVAANYAKNISVPSTDTLYNAVYVPLSSDASQPAAETSDSYDLSLRYQRSIVQAGITGWYSKYVNRIVSAFNDDCQCSVDTNLGAVKKYGIDGSVSVRPIPQVLAYVFGSYIHSEIEDNVAGVGGTLVATAGKRERNTPKFMYGGRLQGSLGNLDVGGQVKYTGSRFLNDINTQKFGGYTVVDLDVRYSLASFGMPKTAIQLNLTNLFDKFYIGSFSGGLTTANSTNVNFGSPRAISGSLIVGF